jgi:hypothetical protein
MHSDKKMFLLLLVIIIVPICLGFCSSERFRYPCQDPKNWDKDFCEVPICDVTKTCPEQIFKGQRDPRVGPNETQSNQTPVPQSAKGVNCAK